MRAAGAIRLWAMPTYLAPWPSVSNTAPSGAFRACCHFTKNPVPIRVYGHFCGSAKRIPMHAGSMPASSSFSPVQSVSRLAALDQSETKRPDSSHSSPLRHRHLPLSAPAICFASAAGLGGECLRRAARGEERWGDTAYAQMGRKPDAHDPA